jgi:hypothetical protein
MDQKTKLPPKGGVSETVGFAAESAAYFFFRLDDMSKFIESVPSSGIV